jgi:hypothetical protein
MMESQSLDEIGERIIENKEEIERTYKGSFKKEEIEMKKGGGDALSSIDEEENVNCQNLPVIGQVVMEFESESGGRKKGVSRRDNVMGRNHSQAANSTLQSHATTGMVVGGQAFPDMNMFTFNKIDLKSINSNNYFAPK